MTVQQIEDRMAKEQIKRETATAIRRLLDEARAKYESIESGNWKLDDAEDAILELVTGVS